ncbi:TetR/AcrR family transcriptional regulator [Sinosporangium siamense]|uniref:HTH tetR-type domain-containing protein n=1 Tax=Sinosporangium siamense TaxID=1367973 RepID=A0A919RCD0_9ACTN|nr:TetR/AcrR family transcriptional regulator [Sinosporangium siamense]GII91303.1 hypothetical protein Ssi02_15340 [Sinosporangium siamense]
MHQPGLRELKKERTRLALVDAGLDLFLSQGYEATTVDQIAAAVDVSPRTLFRYFPTKEDLALHYVFASEQAILAALAAQPADESPFSALRSAYRCMLQAVEDSTPEEIQRFMRTRTLLDANPTLIGRATARTHDSERRMAAEIARRVGVDPEHDFRPMLIVGLLTTTVRIGFECHPGKLQNSKDLVTTAEAVLDFLERSLRPGWDDLGTPL